MINSESHLGGPPSEAKLDPYKLAGETIGREGLAQINEALQATAGLEGNDLNRALFEYYKGIKPEGLEAVVAKLSDPNVPAVLISYGEKNEQADIAERRREGAARLLFLARGLGEAWTRHYEQEGALIQVVHPEKGYENTQSSKGMTPLLPHGEILPEGEISIRESRPKFTALHAISNNPGTPTTLFDTKPAIARLSPVSLAILQEPRFRYLGTDLERMDSDNPEANNDGTPLPVLYPLRDEQGQLTGYDVVIDFDQETMKPANNDTEAMNAWNEFLESVLAEEVSVTIPEQQTVVWQNGYDSNDAAHGAVVLHGRKHAISNPNRELFRVQIGKA